MALAEEAERYERHCPLHHVAVDDDLVCPGPPSHQLADRAVASWDVYDTAERRYTYRTKVKVAMDHRRCPGCHRRGVRAGERECQTCAAPGTRP